MTPLRHHPTERDTPTPITPPEGPFEVWALSDDGAERILSTHDEAHAQTTFRKHGHAVARGGVCLRFDVNLNRAQQAVLKHAVKYPPVTPTPPAEEAPAVHEDPVKTKDKGPEIAPPPCTAKDCDQPCGRVRADTQPALANLCPHDRNLAHGRARDWGLSLDAAAQTLRDGVTERPSEAVPSRRGHRDPKPSKRSQSAKKVPTKTARKVAKAKASKPRVTPSQSPTEALGARLASLRGVTEERVREIAREVVEAELAKLLKVFA